MAEKYKKLLNTLTFMDKLEKNQQKLFIEKSPPHITRILSNFIFNIFVKSFPLDEATILKLKPLKKEFEEFCKKKNSLKLRKKLLLANNFVFKVINIIVPHMKEVLLNSEPK